MNTTTFVLTGIDSSHADNLRALGGITYVADESPGYPCRQCLRDAEVGEELLLVSYDPFTASSPYRCASPIFIHSKSCTPHDAAGLPTQLTSRKLSVRAFDDEAMMLDAALIDGTDLFKTIYHLLSNPSVEVLHLHNAPRGCWAAPPHRSMNDLGAGLARRSGAVNIAWRPDQFGAPPGSRTPNQRIKSPLLYR